MFTHGNMKGPLKPESGDAVDSEVHDYMNSLLKAQGVGQWSSFVLFRNAATDIHADVHNLAGTMDKR